MPWPRSLAESVAANIVAAGLVAVGSAMVALFKDAPVYLVWLVGLLAFATTLFSITELQRRGWWFGEKREFKPPHPMMFGSLIISIIAVLLVFFSYAPYQVQAPVAPPLALPPIIRSWGADPPTCVAVIDTAQLMKFRDKYNVAMACGFNDPTIDRFQDRGITISSTFIIRPGAIHIAAQYSKEMEATLGKRREQARKAGSATVSLSTWYEIILLPKGADVSSIYRLSDVARHDGKVLSQHFP